jgi:hypothetical protein
MEHAADAEDEFLDLFRSRYGTRQFDRWHGWRYARAVDALHTARLALNPAYLGLRAKAARMPARRVLVTAVDVPGRRADLDGVVRALQDSRHEVAVRLAPMGDRGKFQNINAALEGVDMGAYDWLLVTDDDVVLPPRFLDLFLCVAEGADLRVCQPAHRFHSHASWAVTQRAWNSLAHVTHYVETGPMTAFHKSFFPLCLPFPNTRWAWGVDVLWSEAARRRGWRIGVVDATPIEHVREIAQSYAREAAIVEAQQLLATNGVRRNSRELMRTVEVVRRL